MWQRSLLVLLVLVLAFASDALAQEVDTVRLRSGGIVRGTVLEYEPGEAVVLRTVLGEIRTVEAADVASVTLASEAGSAADPPLESEASDPTSLELETPSPASTEWEAGASSESSGLAAGVVPRSWSEPRVFEPREDRAPWDNPPLRTLGQPHELAFGLLGGLGAYVGTVPRYFIDDGSLQGDVTVWLVGEATAVLQIPGVVNSHAWRVELGVQLGPPRMLSRVSQAWPVGVSPRLRLLSSWRLVDELSFRLGAVAGVDFLGDHQMFFPLQGAVQIAVHLPELEGLELGVNVDIGGDVFSTNLGNVDSADVRPRLYAGYIF